MAGARHRDEPVVEHNGLAELACRGSEPVDGCIDSPLAESALEVDRTRPGAECDLHAWRDEREPLAEPHRHHRPQRVRNRHEELALRRPGVESPRRGHGRAHRNERIAQVRIDEVGHRRRQHAA